MDGEICGCRELQLAPVRVVMGTMLGPVAVMVLSVRPPLTLGLRRGERTGDYGAGIFQMY